MTREQRDREFWAEILQMIKEDREEARRNPEKAKEILISAGVLLENGEPAPGYRFRNDDD